MIDGPHIFGFSPVAACISLTSARASARLFSSATAPMKAATLAFVCFVLFSAIRSALPLRDDFSEHAPRGRRSPLVPAGNGPGHGQNAALGGGSCPDRSIASHETQTADVVVRAPLIDAVTVGKRRNVEGDRDRPDE